MNLRDELHQTTGFYFDPKEKPSETLKRLSASGRIDQKKIGDIVAVILDYLDSKK